MDSGLAALDTKKSLNPASIYLSGFPYFYLVHTYSSHAMNSIQQTAQAFVTVCKALPKEVREEVKQVILLEEDGEATDVVNERVARYQKMNETMAPLRKALPDDHERSLRLAYCDSLIIATALQTGCILLYSEDMHHGQIISYPQVQQSLPLKAPALFRSQLPARPAAGFVFFYLPLLMTTRTGQDS
jgi:hypothetical protein